MASARSSLTSTLLKLYVFSLLLSSWLAFAQNIPNLPSCAQPCAEGAAQASGCSGNDAACLCKNNSFSSATIQCSYRTCSKEDQSSAIGAIDSFCAGAQPTTTTSTSASSTQTSTTSSTSTKPGNTSTDPSTSTTTNQPGTGTTTQTTVPVTPPASSSGPLTPVTTLSLPSSAIPTGTSVVLQTITGTPTNNAALGMRAAFDGPLLGVVGVGIVGVVLGSLAVL